MTVRTESGTGEPVRRGAADRASTFTGPLDSLLGSAPIFRSKVRGYDPVEVDAYVSWAESELGSVRREVDDLLARFGACSAELEISRRLLAEGSRNRVVFPVSDRVQEMLQLAAEEAAALTEAGAREAERLVAEARSEADARLRKAHEIKQMAVRAADELGEQAQRQRAEAQDLLDRARADGAELLRAAAEERDRLATAAAQERDRLAAAAAAERRRLGEEAVREREQATAAATARLTALEEQVAELRRRHDEARRSLHGMSARIGEALEVVAATGPAGGDAGTEANIAVEGMEYDPAHVGSASPPRATGEGLVLAGPASPSSS